MCLCVTQCRTWHDLQAWQSWRQTVVSGCLCMLSMTAQRQRMCIWLGVKRSVSCLTGTINKTDAMKSPSNHLELVLCRNVCKRGRSSSVTCGILPNLFHASVYPNSDSWAWPHRQRWCAWFKPVWQSATIFSQIWGHFASLWNELTICCTAFSMKKQADLFPANLTRAFLCAPAPTASSFMATIVVQLVGGTPNNQEHKRIVCLCEHV